MSASEETGTMSFSTPEGSPSVDNPNDGLGPSRLSDSGGDSSLGTFQLEFPSFPSATSPASTLPLPCDFDFPFPPEEHREQSRDSMDSTPTSSLMVSTLSRGFTIVYHWILLSSPSPACPALRDCPLAPSCSPSTHPPRPWRETEASPEGNTGVWHTSPISSAGPPLGSPPALSYSPISISSAGPPLGSPSALSYSPISISSAGPPLGSPVGPSCSPNNPLRPRRETEASPRDNTGARHTSPISSVGSPMGSLSALSYSPISISSAGSPFGSPVGPGCSPNTHPRPRRETEASTRDITRAWPTSPISSAASPLGSASAMSYSPISISSAGSPLASPVGPGFSPNTHLRYQRETEACPRHITSAWHTSPVSSTGSPLGLPSALSYSPISISSTASRLGSPSALSYTPISMSSAVSPLGSPVAPGCSPNTPPRPRRETEASPRDITHALHTSPISSVGSPLGWHSALRYSPISVSSMGSPLGSPVGPGCSRNTHPRSRWETDASPRDITGALHTSPISSAGSPVGSPLALSYSPISTSSLVSPLGSPVAPCCSPNTPARPQQETESSTRDMTGTCHTSPISSTGSPLGSLSSLSYSPVSISSTGSPLASPVAPSSSSQWGTESRPRGTTNRWQNHPTSSTGSPLGSPTAPWDCLVDPSSSLTTPKFLPELARPRQESPVSSQTSELYSPSFPPYPAVTRGYFRGLPFSPGFTLACTHGLTDTLPCGFLTPAVGQRPGPHEPGSCLFLHGASHCHTPPRGRDFRASRWRTHPCPSPCYCHPLALKRERSQGCPQHPCAYRRDPLTLPPPGPCGRQPQPAGVLVGDTADGGDHGPHPATTRAHPHGLVSWLESSPGF